MAHYAYDAQGRRKAKTVGSAATIFVTDADNREILEYDGSSGAVKSWHAYGLGSNEVLNRMDLAAGTRQTMIPDLQGSIIATLESGSGAVARTGYGPFGENPSLTSGSFNYTAQRLDTETAGSAAEPSGLYYYRARMYSPTMGRFLQVDPIGYGDGGNLYAYVNNDPINNIDPTGRQTATGIQMAAGFSACGGSAACQNAQIAAYQKQAPYVLGASLLALGGLAAPELLAAGGGAVTNAVPTTVARVISGTGSFSTLGPPGAADVFVTSGRAVSGLTPQGISEALTIPYSESYTVIEFSTPTEGLASPIARANPGFVGGGTTAGGAPEFVLPNGPIPQGATVSTVTNDLVPFAPLGPAFTGALNGLSSLSTGGVTNGK